MPLGLVGTGCYEIEQNDTQKNVKQQNDTNRNAKQLNVSHIITCKRIL
jgi:hypothetical protein